MQNLLKNRENLIIQINVIAMDLKEYCQFPCDSVDVVQIKYQYDMVLRDIVIIDKKINRLLFESITIAKDKVNCYDKILEKIKKSFFDPKRLPVLKENFWNDQQFN